MTETDEVILRSLDDGWEYQPDWRHRIVESYVARCMTTDEPMLPQAILDAEKDPFVRQAFRHRMGLGAVNAKAMNFAYRTFHQNKTSDLSSAIKSLVVADRRVGEIAEALHIARENVATFTKMFFDVERFLGTEAWLRSVVFQSEIEGRNDAESVRERRLMRIAYFDGFPGLEAALFNRTPPTKASIEKLRLAIQSALSARALEYARDIQASGTAAAPEDLARYVAVSNLNVQPSNDKGIDAAKFAKALLGVLENESEEASDSNLSRVHAGTTGIKSCCDEVPRYRKCA